MTQKIKTFDEMAADLTAMGLKLRVEWLEAEVARWAKQHDRDTQIINTVCAERDLHKKHAEQAQRELDAANRVLVLLRQGRKPQ